MSDKKPQQGEFCWNELVTQDPNKAKEFYKALFGWEAADYPMDEMTYTMFKQGDKDIGGLVKIPGVPPHWMSYICVNNLDEMVKKAEKLGAKIKKSATKAGEFGRLAIIEDTTGAHFAFWEPAK